DAGSYLNTACVNDGANGAAEKCADATVPGIKNPDLRIRKAVGESADGPFVNILTEKPGTTVFYQITVTNIGNIALTGVTLSDNTFDLAAKGCTIPATLAVDASFN